MPGLGTALRCVSSQFNPHILTVAWCVVCETVQTGELSWDSHEQGVVLAAFYYGYSVTLLVSGCVSLPRRCRMSSRCVLLCGSLVTCVMTLLTPVLTLIGDVIALIVTRAVAGIGQVTYTRVSSYGFTMSVIAW